MSPLFNTALFGLLTALVPLQHLSGVDAAPAPLDARDVALGFPYGTSKVRGVNLGGVSLLS